MTRDRDGRGCLRALLPIPGQIDRFSCTARGSRDRGQLRFLPLGGTVCACTSGALFSRATKLTGILHVPRAARTATSRSREEAEDLVREFETALKRRRRRRGWCAPDQRGRARRPVKDGIIDQLHVTADGGGGGQRDDRLVSLKELVTDAAARPFVALLHARGCRNGLQDHDGDMFAAIRQKGHAAATTPTRPSTW